MNKIDLGKTKINKLLLTKKRYPFSLPIVMPVKVAGKSFS